MDRHLECVRKGGFKDPKFLPKDFVYIQGYLKADENLRKLKASGQLETWARRVMDARALW